MGFDCSKSKENPHLWFYKITLKAWRVFTPDAPPKEEAVVAETSNLAKALNMIEKVLDTISAVGNLIDAITQDLERVFNIALKVLNVVKGILQVAKKIMDFPKMIAAKFKDLVRAIKNKLKQISSIFKNKTPTQIKNINASLQKMSGLLSSSATTGMINEAQNPFASSKNIISNFSLLNLIDLTEIPLSTEDRDLITKEDAITAAVTVRDLNIMKEDVRRIRDTFADSRRLGNTTYNRIFDRQNTTSQSKRATTQDHQVIKALTDLIYVIDNVTVAKLDRKTIRRPDPFLRIQTLSDETSAGLSVITPQRAFPIPF